MAWHRERLEGRQAQVARLAEIGVELFVIAAAASYAVGDRARTRLARQVYLDARRRIEAAFAAIGGNDDRETDELGLEVLGGGFAGLLEGSMAGSALHLPGAAPLDPGEVRTEGART